MKKSMIAAMILGFLSNQAIANHETWCTADLDVVEKVGGVASVPSRYTVKIHNNTLQKHKYNVVYTANFNGVDEYVVDRFTVELPTNERQVIDKSLGIVKHDVSRNYSVGVKIRVTGDDDTDKSATCTGRIICCGK